MAPKSPQFFTKIVGRALYSSGARKFFVEGAVLTMYSDREAGFPTPKVTRVKLEREMLGARLERCKKSFVCRRADLAGTQALSRTVRPRAGDLVLATVLEIGQHARLESIHGRRAQLFPGDEILVAYGARYAPDQFEAVVPDDVGPCDLVAGGGIAARAVARHANVKKATTIAPLGVLVDAAGRAVNLDRFALQAAPVSAARNVVAVVGTSMNAGKTTAAASLIRGLSNAGLRVGACKVTGTGSGGDLWSMVDAGAVKALDFTDAGFATTSHADIAAVEAGAHLLVSHLEAEQVDIVVVEIADGLLQRETAALLNTSFAARLDSIILAAGDAMGAIGGAEWLLSRNLPLRAVTGLVTASPLAMREAQAALRTEVVPTKDLTDGSFASQLSLRSGARMPRSVAG